MLHSTRHSLPFQLPTPPSWTHSRGGFWSIPTKHWKTVIDPENFSKNYMMTNNILAGMPLESITGTKTSVYTGCFTNDWQHLCLKDPEQCETTTALGTQACVNANRISWFFNFTGNSANIDTACSSSLVALDMGCKGLLCRDTEMVRPKLTTSSKFGVIDVA